MLMLRLQKIGKKKNPTYRLVVSEKNKDTQSGSLENLGVYNSVCSPKLVDFKKDRILYWLSVGAQASASVNNLLVAQGIIKADKQKSVSITKRRQEKMAKKKAEAEGAKAEAEKKAVEKKAAEEEAKVESAGEGTLIPILHRDEIPIEVGEEVKSELAIAEEIKEGSNKRNEMGDEKLEIEESASVEDKPAEEKE